MNEYGIKNLCSAVVKQACLDYLKSIRYLDNARYKNNRTYEYHLRMKEDCERFFLNKDLFSLYCDMDGEWIMNTIREQSHNPYYKIYES